MYKINNKAELKNYRKGLRQKMTKAEIALWSKIKNSQIAEHKFRRQHSIGFYILDFYCTDLKLAIELDGSSHDSDEKFKYDKNRTSYLKNLGIIILRFENNAVIENIEAVLFEINKYIKNGINK